jgi:peptidoglycan-N-acetylglucosamine deacetylase
MCRVSHSLLACLLMASVASFGAPRDAHAQSRSRSAPGFWAFTGPWDPASDASVAKNASALDVVVTGWIGLDSVTAEPILPSPYVDRFSDRGARRTSAERFAIVTSWHGLRFHSSSVHVLGGNANRLGRAASKIAAAAQAAGYRGLVLDFEDEQPSELGRLLTVVKAVTDSAHAHGVRRVALAVPAADTDAYPTRALLGVTDLLLPMLYDEHWDSSPPGAISEPSWVRSTLAARLAGVDPSRIVAGLPTYSYEWPRGRPGEQISYTQARALARRGGARLTRDPATSTLHGIEKSGGQIWVTDAELLRTLVDVVHSLGVRRISLWRLGQEDPAIWERVIRR